MLVEHNGEKVAAITYNAISAATHIGGSISALVVGPDCSKVSNEIYLNAFACIIPMAAQVAGQLAEAEGVSKVIVAQHKCFGGFLPGKFFQKKKKKNADTFQCAVSFYNARDNDTFAS